MITTQQMAAAERSDSDLVAECLSGKRDAFGRIVQRYQSLICSLAYCATGSLGESEDLAQETFVTAWQQLARLRDPAKLRPWLCGIARCLIGKALRRAGREPVHAAAPLEETDGGVELTPSERVITKEEQAILWRSIERIPEIYRESLVLFYREHQSVERVAAALGISEDAVKQRLARGRKLLQEQVLAFVAGALESSSPGKAFTLAVLAAIPTFGMAVSATAATSVTAKSSSTAAGAGSLSTIGAVISWGVICFFSVLGFFGFIGGFLGWIMGRAAEQSVKQCQNVIRFWRILAVGFAAFMVPVLSVLWALPRDRLPSNLWNGLRRWMTLMCPVLLIALVTWGWRWWRDLPQHEDLEAAPDLPRAVRKQLLVWSISGATVPLALLVLCVFGIFFDSTWRSERIPIAEAERLLEQHHDARVWIVRLKNGSNLMRIKLPEMTHFLSYETTADAHTFEVLKLAGIHYDTRKEENQRDLGGAPALLMLFSAFFLGPAGSILILLQWRAWRRLQAPAKSSVPASKGVSGFDQVLVRLRTHRAPRKAFAVMFAVLFLITFALGLLLTFLPTTWYSSTARVRLEKVSPETVRNEVAGFWSNALLDGVVNDLELADRWSRFNGGRSLTAEETRAVVKSLVLVRIAPEPGEILIEGVDTSPPESAMVANRVADIYCQSRQNIDARVIQPASQSVCLHPPEKRVFTCTMGAFGGLFVGLLGGSAAAWVSARRRNES